MIKICVNWNAVAAVGTILAAFVGIVGIFLNLHEKTRRLSIKSEYVQKLTLYVTNNSLRTVIITKIVYNIKHHVFYVDIPSGLQEKKISPGAVETIIPDLKKVALYMSQIEYLCNSGDRVEIIIHDNYRRKYRIKTDMTKDMLSEISNRK